MQCFINGKFSRERIIEYCLPDSTTDLLVHKTVCDFVTSVGDRNEIMKLHHNCHLMLDQALSLGHLLTEFLISNWSGVLLRVEDQSLLCWLPWAVASGRWWASWATERGSGSTWTRGWGSSFPGFTLPCSASSPWWTLTQTPSMTTWSVEIEKCNQKWVL